MSGFALRGIGLNGATVPNADNIPRGFNKATVPSQLAPLGRKLSVYSSFVVGNNFDGAAVAITASISRNSPRSGNIITSKADLALSFP